jgi:hypothetical protein
MATDFNNKYELTPESVLDDADVLSPDFLSSMFVRVSTTTPASAYLAAFITRSK